MTSLPPLPGRECINGGLTCSVLTCQRASVLSNPAKLQFQVFPSGWEPPNRNCPHQRAANTGLPWVTGQWASPGLGARVQQMLLGADSRAWASCAVPSPLPHASTLSLIVTGFPKLALYGNALRSLLNADSDSAAQERGLSSCVSNQSQVTEPLDALLPSPFPASTWMLLL